MFSIQFLMRSNPSTTVIKSRSTLFRVLHFIRSRIPPLNRTAIIIEFKSEVQEKLNEKLGEKLESVFFRKGTHFGSKL